MRDTCVVTGTVKFPPPFGCLTEHRHNWDAWRNGCFIDASEQLEVFTVDRTFPENCAVLSVHINRRPYPTTTRGVKEVIPIPVDAIVGGDRLIAKSQKVDAVSQCGQIGWSVQRV
jgi:hypothetical protein